jgi:adenylosuccinate synthase
VGRRRQGQDDRRAAEHVTAVVRYQGGDNAGHTIMLGEEVFKLHLVPSGVLYPHIAPIIGNGVVVNPATLIAELDMLASRGIEVDRVRVSKHAHVIMPYHIALDGAMEARLAKAAVGTTRRGIGPAYADRAWRIGIRMEDLLDGPALRGKLARILPEKNATLQRQHRVEGFDLDELVALATEWGKRLRRTWPTPLSWSRRCWPAASTFCSKARRARCSTSTTAAIRS